MQETDLVFAAVAHIYKLANVLGLGAINIEVNKKNVIFFCVDSKQVLQQRGYVTSGLARPLTFNVRTFKCHALLCRQNLNAI